MSPSSVLPLSKRISSRLTFYYKRVFPMIWFGLLAVFTVILFLAPKSGLEKLALAVPFVMAAFGYYIMKWLVWDLADEVYDQDSFLTVNNKGNKRRVLIADIVSVQYNTLTNPQRVTLILRNQVGDLPSRITFAPPVVWIPFARHRLITELIARIAK